MRSRKDRENGEKTERKTAEKEDSSAKENSI
jgi:hypothetical protein